jgi:hypothetical protein
MLIEELIWKCCQNTSSYLKSNIPYYFKFAWINSVRNKVFSIAIIQGKLNLSLECKTLQSPTKFVNFHSLWQNYKITEHIKTNRRNKYHNDTNQVMSSKVLGKLLQSSFRPNPIL